MGENNASWTNLLLQKDSQAGCAEHNYWDVLMGNLSDVSQVFEEKLAWQLLSLSLTSHAADDDALNSGQESNLLSTTQDESMLDLLSLLPILLISATIYLRDFHER